MRYVFAFILSFLIFSEGFAQNYARNWYFGRQAGIRFEKDGVRPQILLDSEMRTREGCASISDNKGNLLFYSNGINVWNKNHEIMPNGHNLSGHQSTTQSALIIPKPEYPDIYLLFTLAKEGSGGLSYSIIDMTLEGGLGDIIEKDIPLLNPATEKMAAIFHTNAKDVWLAAHKWDSDEYYMYRINSNGIDGPVINKIGTEHKGIFWNAIGQMQFSPDGKKLACVIANRGLVEVFNFDINSGKLSDSFFSIQLPDNEMGYGLEFSPSGKFIYISTNSSKTGESNSGYIYQIDLEAGDEKAVANSLIKIGITSPPSLMQMGPDKKIYTPGNNSLSVIENPELQGENCDYQRNRINLGGRDPRVSMPAFIQSYYYYYDNELTVCEGDSIFIESDYAYAYLKSKEYYWDGPAGFFYDKDLRISNIRKEHSGFYHFIVRYKDGNQDTTGHIVYRVAVISSPNSNIEVASNPNFCSGRDVELQAEVIDPYFRYYWSTGMEGPYLTVNKSGVYKLYVENNAGCIDSSEINVQFAKEPDYRIYAPKYICKGSEGYLTTGEGLTRYEWSNGETTRSIRITKGGKYSLTSYDAFGCEYYWEHTVEDYDVHFDEVNEIDFGSGRQGRPDTTLKIINKLDSPLIFNASLANGDIFHLAEPGRQELNPGHNMNLNLKFRPKDNLYYTDTLIIEMLAPCEGIYRIPLKGSLKLDLILWIPSEKGKVGSDLKLKLLGRLNTESDITTSSVVDIKIAVDFRAFKPEVQSSYKDSLVIISLNGPELEIGKTPVTIGEIQGRVLMGVRDDNPALIYHYEWHDNLVNVTSQGGILSVNGVCVLPLNRIKSFDPLSLDILPNPSQNSPHIKIAGTLEGAMKLDIIDLNGRLVYSENINKKENEVFSIKPDIRKLPAGLYTVKLTAPFDIIAKRLTIIK
ncbi:MAG: T9SS type A sorting domain-containing protein [Bacteroidota bacterium]